MLNDRETVKQIQENPYLQYFVGLPGYQMQAPFTPSLLVDVRKRMGSDVFEVFHQSVIDAVSVQKAAQKSSKNQTSSATPVATTSDDDDDQGGGCCGEDQVQSAQPVEPANEGRLLLDATVAEQAIRYPTDLSLLNEAREFSEKIINQLYPHTDEDKKPRTYR